jgi:ribonuclease HII
MIHQLTREEGLAAVLSTRRDYIIGIDEVGLGACAGPLVVGAVVLRNHWGHERVRDSKSFKDNKKQTAHEKRLEVVRELVIPNALAHSTLWASSVDVDANGIDLAVQKLTYWLYAWCKRQFPEALTVLDGNASHYFRSPEYEDTISFPEADGAVAAVSAASLIAKTERDRYLLLLDKVHPGYGFAKHKGYPTPEHKKAMAALGMCEEHRRSYKTAMIGNYGR